MSFLLRRVRIGSLLSWNDSTLFEMESGASSTRPDDSARANNLSVRVSFGQSMTIVEYLLDIYWRLV